MAHFSRLNNYIRGAQSGSSGMNSAHSTLSLVREQRFGEEYFGNDIDVYQQDDAIRFLEENLERVASFIFLIICNVLWLNRQKRDGFLMLRS
jgi:hypothetical protein